VAGDVEHGNAGWDVDMEKQHKENKMHNLPLKKMILPGILIIISIIFSSCAANGGDKPASPVKINVQFSEPPKLNQVVSLKISISTLISLDNIQVQLRLPDGFTLVSGELNGSLVWMRIKVMKWKLWLWQIL